MNNDNKIILDLCGGTGAWSKPYRDAGYDVRLITLPEYDVRTYIPPENVYGVLAAPPCTEFSCAVNLHGKKLSAKRDFKKGLETVSACMRIILTCKPAFWALENPATGCLKMWLKNPTMIFEPWEFGDNYQKKTALWGVFKMPFPSVTQKPMDLKKFSLLKSKEIHPEFYGKLTRQERRAITPAGFAKAFMEVNQ